jgi:AsmA protein
MFKKLVIIFGVIIIGLVIALMMVDLNSYKPKIQQLVKESSGYDVKIAGNIGISFAPIGVSVHKVSITNPGEGTFAKLDSFDITLELMSLLKKEIKVNYITLGKLDLTIEKLKNGKLNFEVDSPKKAKKETISEAIQEKPVSQIKLRLINVTEVRVKDSNINYKDLQINSEIKLQNINVVINDIKLDSAKEKLQGIAFKGNVKIDTIAYDKYKIRNTSVEFDMKDAIANVTKMGYTIFDSAASGTARVDLNGKFPKVALSQNIPNLKLSNFSKEVLEKDLLDGVTNTDIKLAFVAGDLKQIKETLSGSVLFDGQKVTLKGYDLDKIAKTYNDTKDTKNLNLGSILTTVANADINVGTTAVEHLHVKVDIDKRIARLSDIAIATLKNRLAIKGSTDIVSESFNNVQVGLLDQKGCANFSQTIQGTFSKPSIKVDEGMVNTVVNMATSFFGKVANLGVAAKKDEPCKIFYNGVVKHS